MPKLIKSVQEVAYHRNGVSGVGFYAIRFTAEIESVNEEEAAMRNLPPTVGAKEANWLAIVHDKPGYCSVICLDLIAKCGVKFAGGNSWRGDRYEPELREAIRTTPTSGGTRVGSFCVPE